RTSPNSNDGCFRVPATYISLVVGHQRSADVRLIHAVATKLAILVVAAVGASACSKGATTGGPSIPPIVADTSCARASIGIAGGVLSHPAGGKLSVPSGAVEANTEFSLCGIAAPPASALGGPALGQGYEAGPPGQAFLRPVQISMTFAAQRLPMGADAKNV